MESSSLESEGEGVDGATARGRGSGIPGGTVRPTTRGVGTREPAGLPAEGSDTTVDATPAEGYTTERPDGPDQQPDAQPESEVRDGIYDRDTVGRVGRGETVRGGVSETDIAGRGSSRDTGEPNGTDAVVDDDTGLEASEGTYTLIREQHVGSTPLVTSLNLPLV